MIDNFAGAVLGTRTVTGLPSPDQGTHPARHLQPDPGAWAGSSATGNGNRPGGVQLDYAFPSTDLRAGAPNTRLLVEFATIDRQPEPPAPQGAALVRSPSTTRTADRAATAPCWTTAATSTSRSISTAGPGRRPASAATPTSPGRPSLMIQVMYPASNDRHRVAGSRDRHHPERPGRRRGAAGAAHPGDRESGRGRGVRHDRHRRGVSGRLPQRAASRRWSVTRRTARTACGRATSS